MAGRIEPATAMRRRARPLPRRLCIEATIELAVAVAGARELFKSNAAFGEWWDAQGFGLNCQDRMALAAMGKDPERLREVLGVTKRLSIQLIYKEEFRFANVSKTENQDPPKSDKPEGKKGGNRNKPEPAAAEPVAPEAPALDATPLNGRLWKTAPGHKSKTQLVDGSPIPPSVPVGAGSGWEARRVP